MVPFEYDTDPLGLDFTLIPPQPKGWRVDGSLLTDENQTIPGSRGLVWGCKPPEVILTETLAFHDRRIADTAWDNATRTKVDPNDPNKDQDFDQTRIPQGSAFFELYCTRDLHDTTPPYDLYDKNTNKLDLGRIARLMATGGNIRVWRLVNWYKQSGQRKNNDRNAITRITPTLFRRSRNNIRMPPLN